MKILNTKPRQSFTKGDFHKMEITISDWGMRPQTVLMSEIQFTTLLDLSREEDSAFVAWLDELVAREG